MSLMDPLTGTQPRIVRHLSRALPLLALGALLATSLSAEPPQQRVAYAQTSGSANVIPIKDPTLGMQAGSLTLLPGWHGEAHMDRSTDPMQNGIAVLTVRISTADGSASTEGLPVLFHTYSPQERQAGPYMPGNPLAQRNAAFVRFTSATDLLMHQILPMLALGGRPGTPAIIQQAESAQATEAMRRQNFQSPLSQSASVLVHGTRPGQEALVIINVTGFSMGSPREGTTANIEVIRAPEGHAQEIFDAAQRLPPPPPPSQQWQEADGRYYQMRQKQQQEQFDAINARTNSDTQAIVRQGQANVAAIQQAGAARHSAWIDHENQVTYHGQQTRDRILNESHSYCYEDNSGHRQWVNSAVAPGAGYHPCRS